MLKELQNKSEYMLRIATVVYNCFMDYMKSVYEKTRGNPCNIKTIFHNSKYFRDVSTLIDPDIFCYFNEKQVNGILKFDEFWNINCAINYEIDDNIDKTIFERLLNDPIKINIPKLFPQFKKLLFISQISRYNLRELHLTGQFGCLHPVYQYRINKFCHDYPDSEYQQSKKMGAVLFGEEFGYDDGYFDLVDMLNEM